VVHCDSFTIDIHSTQRSEGMKNVFKKWFRWILGLSELLFECENVVVDLRSNEKDADFESSRKIPVSYIPNMPRWKLQLKHIQGKCISSLKKQFTLTCDLLEANDTNLMFFVRYMQSDRGATILLNTTIRLLHALVGCLNA
jgi:hypothetical protein